VRLGLISVRDRPTVGTAVIGRALGILTIPTRRLLTSALTLLLLSLSLLGALSSLRTHGVSSIATLGERRRDVPPRVVLELEHGSSSMPDSTVALLHTMCLDGCHAKSVQPVFPRQTRIVSMCPRNTSNVVLAKSLKSWRAAIDLILTLPMGQRSGVLLPLT
jgi:hypothetical protein